MIFWEELKHQNDINTRVILFLLLINFFFIILLLYVHVYTVIHV